VIVEKLHFQSLPGLYVTANLYRPIEQNEPLPAILYVCGHGGVKKDGISYGNKARYQHHGGWFARHGYVCLTIDTIQLGEIEGIHHGTYREGMWWWNNRGYTPAGVEAWNCVRSLDYLQSRPEVDEQRIGVTGRSGGGAYSWWIAAIDERVAAAVPVAGITSLKNHVVDGCVEGHCDCMYMVNTYRWDYPLVAALVAPRPLLISNSDKDRIFPLDGVVDVHSKVRKIYELYDAGDKLGLQITEGPHKDTQELRVHAFRWFNRFLRGTDELLRSPATPLFEEEQLRVFQSLPSDERVTSIHDSFVPAADPESLPTSLGQLQEASEQWMTALKEKTFRGWPDNPSEPRHEIVADVRRQGFRLRIIEFTSQSPFRLPIYLLSSEDADSAENRDSSRLVVRPVTQAQWQSLAGGLAAAFPNEFPHAEPNPDAWTKLTTDLGSHSLALVLPRGVGPTQWSGDERKQIQIRRRFMQVGQTLAGMQIYDVVRALQLIHSSDTVRPETLRLSAKGKAASWALFASLFSDVVDELSLQDLPTRNRNAPDLLNVSRFVEVPHVVMMAASRSGECELTFSGDELRDAWREILENQALAADLIRLSEINARD
jgi:dienelactone hydrolase